MAKALSNAKALYRDYKKKALKRGIEFDLVFEEFVKITSSDCYMCGGHPSNCYKQKKAPNAEPYIYNGIDQIIPSAGYIEGNVAPCCWDCNRMKGELSGAELMSHMSKVIFMYLSALGLPNRKR